MAKATAKRSSKAVTKVARKKAPSRKASSTKPLPRVKTDGKTRPEVCGDSETKDWREIASQATGVGDKSLAARIILDATGTFTGNFDDDRALSRALNFSLSMVRGIKPADEVEAMLAAQMVGVHNATMRCLRNAAFEGQTAEGVSINVDRSVKLVKAFTALTDSLNRYRTKGQQKVKVEHVHVHQGGQAVVGDIHHGGGGGNDESEQ